MRSFLKQAIFSPSSPVLLLQIVLISLTGYISMDLYFPSLPAVSHTFNITPNAAQFTVTLFLIGFGSSQLFYGSLSDYLGRRPVLLSGLLIYSLGSLILILSHGIHSLFLGLFVQGMGAGASASLCRVILRDNFSGDKMAQVASYLSIGLALTTALAPLVGGALQSSFSTPGVFLFMGLFSLLTLLLIVLLLPETNSQIQTNFSVSQLKKNHLKVLSNKIFIRSTVYSGLSVGSLLSYAIINPFLLQKQLGISPLLYGAITLLIASGEIVGTYTNGKIVLQLGHQKMLFLGILSMMMGALCFIVCAALGIFTVTSIAVPSFFITFSIGIIIPNATSAAFSEFKDCIGTAGSLYGFLQISIVALTTYCISTLSTPSPWTLGLIFLTLGIFMILTHQIKTNGKPS